MAKYKVTQFADAFDIKESTVKSYVHRKQLRKDAEGFIDTENDINRLFILEMQLKINTGKVKTPEPPKEKKIIEKEPTQTASQKQYTEIDLRLRTATMESKERESELRKVQLEKLAGNLLPVSLVETILVINIQSVFKVFESEIENLASIYNEVFGGTRKELALIIEKQRQILAKAIEKSSKDAKAEIEIAITDYQDVRSRGERK